jgi:hypothetical protein
LRIHELGGVVSKGAYSEVSVTMPARLLDVDDSFGRFNEQEFRREAARCAQALAFAERVVIRAIDELAADRSKTPRPLHERLPDAVATVGGGV